MNSMSHSRSAAAGGEQSPGQVSPHQVEWLLDVLADWPVGVLAVQAEPPRPLLALPLMEWPMAVLPLGGG
jgi:hypothetical protein